MPFGWLSSLLKSQRRLEAENLVLRHGVNILRRRSPGRARLSSLDRLVKDSPTSRSIERFGHIIVEPVVADLHHRYART
jgi:hypothetical protein